MGPALVTQNATNVLAWAQPWPPRMLPMVLHGPSPGHPECYRRSCMGPVLPPTACYRCSCMGPALATQHTTDVLAWASTGPKVCYRCSCMGPVLAPMHATEGLARTQCCPPQRATDDLAWVQPWPPSVLLTVLCGPSTCPNACERWSCMGPALATEHATDGLV